MLRPPLPTALPPRPPPPPSGPPLSIYFSRRKLAAPLPPLPAITSILDSSINFMDLTQTCLKQNVGRAAPDMVGVAHPTPEIKKPYLTIGLILSKQRLPEWITRPRLRWKQFYAFAPP